MANIIQRLIGNKAQSSNFDLGDPNLKQGQRFDYMQNAIISGVLPELPLMEQTTGPGIGSIVEPLEGADADIDVVNTLNQVEMEKLQIMLAQYQELIQELMVFNAIAAAPATYESQNAAGAAGDLKEAITVLNKKIMTLMEKLIVGIDVNHTVNKKAKSDAQIQSKNLNNLLQKKNNLDALLAARATVNGQLMDRRQELDSTYLHYLVWFISAITLAAIAFNKLSKN